MRARTGRRLLLPTAGSVRARVSLSENCQRFACPSYGTTGRSPIVRYRPAIGGNRRVNNVRRETIVKIRAPIGKPAIVWTIRRPRVVFESFAVRPVRFHGRDPGTDAFWDVSSRINVSRPPPPSRGTGQLTAILYAATASTVLRGRVKRRYERRIRPFFTRPARVVRYRPTKR